MIGCMAPSPYRYLTYQYAFPRVSSSTLHSRVKTYYTKRTKSTARPAMDGEEDIDIAAAMGFGSFGNTNKRKYDRTQSPIASADDASGANSTQLGVRPKKFASTQQEAPENSKPSGSNDHSTTDDLSNPLSPESTPHQPHEQPSAMEMVSFGGPPITRNELNALKFGVQDENGDTAYFLPNFVEDPWASLKSNNRT
ncbi:hypothetical protein IAQ61_006862 [Plenodomus lingam]|uniref:uncharacterized protein n=1 Tax=Leptosphaeria maculans TaxID=5022 RepID=UPI00332A37E5|nr:hypothetical protein IAQ61_006862 [Plenodomus lingam]